MTSTPAFSAKPSHLILHVRDTDRTIAFYQALFGAAITEDRIMAAPALDELYGRTGVRLRSVYLDAAGYRLHTLEAVDVRNQGEPPAPRHIGLNGISYAVVGLDARHETLIDAGLEPTPIKEFRHRDRLHSKVCFVDDPDGVRVELVEYFQ